MADRPMATAPERSVAALSTIVILMPLGVGPAGGLEGRAAAGHAAADEEEVGLDLFTCRLRAERKMYRFLFPCYLFLLISCGRLLRASSCEEAGLLEIGEIGLGLARVRVDRAFGGGADRELEPLEDPVAELDGPHDGVGAPHRDDVRAQGREVLIAPDLDRLLRADLDAVVALPALLRLLVVGLHEVPVEDHEVVGADVLAGGLVLRLAAVALLGNNETRHVVTNLLSMECS